MRHGVHSIANSRQSHPVGFIALAKSAVSSEWLTLWIERLRYYGFASPSEGMHFDQNWGHLAWLLLVCHGSVPQLLG